MIRSCGRSDREPWCRLNKEFMSYEYEDENLWENPLEKGDPGEIFDAVMDSGQSPNRLYIIEEESEAVGFVNAVAFTSIWAHGEVLFIDDLFITERCRNRGYGGKALRELEDLVNKEGFRRVQLLAEDTNPGAVSFYEREEYRRQRINLFCKYL